MSKYSQEQLSGWAKEALEAKDKEDFRWDFLVQLLMFYTGSTQEQVENNIRELIK